MSETKTEFKAGDVVRYETLDRPDRHCREGMAIAKAGGNGRVLLVDTFWASFSESHTLTAEEVATAEPVFNLADYDELDRSRHGAAEKWKTYAPADREVVTSQHGLQVRWFIRKGVEPDLATQIDNARDAVGDAYEKLRRAEHGVEYALRSLALLEANQ